MTTDRPSAADVAALIPFRRTLGALDPAAPPSAAQVCGRMISGARRLVAVAGSFNPPHVAHVGLLRAGRMTTHADAGVFVLSARTVDKERVSGMLLEDRLWLLCQIIGDVDRDGVEGAASPSSSSAAALGVVATNQGLYVDQAAALRRLCPSTEAVVFVVGFDKIVQIFDGRYYQDRDAALDELFATASFLVAPRDEHTAKDITDLLDRPENRRYASGAAPLALDAALAGVSSTAAREAMARGEAVEHLVPERVARFVAATGCYRAPDGQGPYAARAAALEALAGPSAGAGNA
ncbi:MAG: nicotinate-nicotinamide nucleotide adenylyltransferase [Chloroflexota bacterium]